MDGRDGGGQSESRPLFGNTYVLEQNLSFAPCVVENGIWWEISTG